MPGDDEKVLRLRALREMIISSINSLYQQSEIIKDNPELFSNFKIRCRNLEKWKNAFDKHHTGIISIVSVQRGTEMNLANELEIYNDFEEKCQSIETVFYELFELPEENRLNDSNANLAKPNFNVKLPKISLLAFDGDLKKFPSFISNFNSLVHENQNLSNIEKFNYLSSVLKGTPSNILKSLPLIDDNYDIAYNSLISRYQNKRLLATAYWKEIYNFRPINSDRALRTLLDVFHENLSALKMLSLPVDNWDFILMQMLIDRLDSDTLKVFEREYASSEIPSYDTVRDTLLKHCVVVESVLLNSKMKDKNTIYSKFSSRKASFLTNTTNNSTTISNANSKNRFHVCFHCKGEHIIFNCPDFISKDPHKRYQIIKSYNACLNCLADSHSLSNCKSNKRCRTCRKTHHTLLHFSTQSPKIEPLTEEKESLPTNSLNEVQSFSSLISRDHSRLSQVFLSTIKLKIKDAYGNIHFVRAILDSGSQVSFISKSLSNLLNLKPFNASLVVQGLDHMCTSAKKAVQCQVYSIHNEDITFQIEAVIIDKICESMPKITLSDHTKKQFDHLLLADPEYFKSGSVDLLLGADIFPYLLQNGRIVSSPGEPVALNTTLGWIIMGKVKIPKSHSVKSFLMISTENDHLHISDDLRKFWEIEEVPSVTCQSPEYIFCENYYAQTTVKTSTGRYSVSLPFKVNSPDFGDTRYLVLKRFFILESKLIKNPDLYSKYSALIREYLDNDQIESIPESKLNVSNTIFYLPHSYVLRRQSTSTPMRIVFDGSSRYPDKSSLNEALFTGPKLQTNLISILLQFRLYRFVFCADIRQMYRMIEVNPEHRDYLRILWRFSSNEKLQEFRLKTLPFGLNCSPYLAIRTIQQLSNEHPELTLAKDLILNNTYVDDISGGDDYFEGALSKVEQVITLLEKGGFELRKWVSNNFKLVENLPSSHVIDNIRNLDLNQENTFQKILGMHWNPSLDSFSFSTLDIPPTCTKRSILSCVARIFDPLGYLTPCIISLKILIQTLWCRGQSWDCTPSDDITKKFLKFRREICHLSELKIPRYFDSILSHKCDLIGFCDSSELAYCAVVYIRVYYNNSFKTFFACAKSKVAPLKKLSIPRLELCAAVLLSKLILFVTNSYEHKLKFSNIFAFSDSTVALTWIKSSPHKWKSFVSNRTAYIQDIVPPERWFYVSSEHNPADIGTRGISPVALVECTLWFEGPSSQVFYPEKNNEFSPIKHKEVTQESARTCLATFTPELDFIHILLTKFNSLYKIIRIVCYSLRFIHNLKSRNNRIYTNKAITSSEIHDALILIAKKVQQSEFLREINLLSSGRMITKSFRKLSPFIDEKGLIRVGGRLMHSNLHYDAKHPILLPKKHIFTELLIFYIHNSFLHAGVNNTLYHLIQMFWVYSAKRTIRSVISKCHQCFKTNPKSYQPTMGDLPKFRVSAVKPFLNTGVDLAGPFSITMNRVRGVKIMKAYLVLFVCCATKAVHLELLSDLSAECFLMGFRRFLARRGRCSNVYSDCGTNFVATSKYLKQIMEFASMKENICWHFNPPSAPHMGGIWEANIKSVKSHILRVIGSQILTYEELYTLIARVEAVLNSRPLCPISSDPNDIRALTPGHFLTLEPLVTLPDTDYTSINLNRLSRWQLIVRMHRDFWNRWSREYLHTLQQKSKWTTQNQHAKEGDMVLIKKENSPPLTWTLGRIAQLFHGKDGVARVASVKTANGIFKRPLIKLCPLPSS